MRVSVSDIYGYCLPEHEDPIQFYQHGPGSPWLFRAADVAEWMDRKGFPLPDELRERAERDGWKPVAEKEET